MDETAGMPSYLVVARDIEGQVSRGELAVGDALPSTQQLVTRYGVSTTVARAAINQLKVSGLVVGRPGKGVFVRATPADLAAAADSVEAVAEQLVEVRAELSRLRSAHDALVDRVTSLETPARRGGTG